MHIFTACFTEGNKVIAGDYNQRTSGYIFFTLIYARQNIHKLQPAGRGYYTYVGAA